MRSNCVIGMDFGTLSARAVLVNVRDGRILAESIFIYPHGVFSEQLMGKKLPGGFALIDPEDYLEALRRLIPDVLQKSGVKPENVIGIGLDATSATMIPVDTDGVPLSSHRKFRTRPHAYGKLWKHHAAQYAADEINFLASKRNEPFLQKCGGKVSSEWMFPKIIEIMDEDREVYDATDTFLDAPDFLVWALTGEKNICSCGAGYKAQWTKEEGYPSAEFFNALRPDYAEILSKLCPDVLPIGSYAGTLTTEVASAMGLLPGTGIAAGMVDAHVALPGAGISKPGEMLMNIGTSACSVVCSPDFHEVPGTCGSVYDGILPGFYGYEAGQPCVGDCLGWFVQNCVPADYTEQAAARNISVHALLAEKADKSGPSAGGLMALDWWNGNRSILNDADLSGMFIGLSMNTKPEYLYRALIESMAFGERKIRDHYYECGVPIQKLYACGGISKKNQFMMQIYADVLNAEIRISPVLQTAALGSAMFAAAAVGSTRGGYDCIEEAIENMSDRNYKIIRPDSRAALNYDSLYSVYSRLYTVFGSKENDIMKELSKYRSSI